jgi:hypothetical protein
MAQPVQIDATESSQSSSDEVSRLPGIDPEESKRDRTMTRRRMHTSAGALVFGLAMASCGVASGAESAAQAQALARTDFQAAGPKDGLIATAPGSSLARVVPAVESIGSVYLETVSGNKNAVVAVAPHATLDGSDLVTGMGQNGQSRSRILGGAHPGRFYARLSQKLTLVGGHWSAGGSVQTGVATNSPAKNATSEKTSAALAARRDVRSLLTFSGGLTRWPAHIATVSALLDSKSVNVATSQSPSQYVASTWQNTLLASTKCPESGGYDTQTHDAIDNNSDGSSPDALGIDDVRIGGAEALPQVYPAAVVVAASGSLESGPWTEKWIETVVPKSGYPHDITRDVECSATPSRQEIKLYAVVVRSDTGKWLLDWLGTLGATPADRQTAEQNPAGGMPTANTLLSGFYGANAWSWNAAPGIPSANLRLDGAD